MSDHEADIHVCELCDKMLSGATSIKTHIAEEHPARMRGPRRFRMFQGAATVQGRASGPSTSFTPPPPPYPKPTIPLLLSPSNQLPTQKQTLIPAAPPGPSSAKVRRLRRVVQQQESQQKVPLEVTMVEGEEENSVIEISDEEQAGEFLQFLDNFKVEVDRDFEVESDTEDEAFRKQITTRKDLIREKKVFVDVFLRDAKAEIISLVTQFSEEEDLKAKAEEELAELDVKRARLTRKCEENNESLKSLKKKKQTMQDSITVKINMIKEEMENLRKELETIQNRQVKYNENKKNNEVKLAEAGPTLPLLEYIGKKIEDKEEELGCPVCFNLASAPIYMCSEEHMVCSACRPKMSQCPECREIYTGGFRRHRFAEKAAEELVRLYRERAEVLGD